MKRIILLMVCMLFILPIVSAINWDNGIDYKNNNMTVEIENGYFFGLGDWFGFNEKLGEATLLSHKTPDEIIQVYEGEVLTLYYNLTFNESYKGGLGEVEFTNLNNNKEVERNYSFAIVTLAYCEDVVHANLSKNTLCYDNEWEIINNTNIPKGNSVIGLIVDVQKNDLIDAVWTIAGKKISRHAGFTAFEDVLSWDLTGTDSAPTGITSNGSDVFTCANTLMHHYLADGTFVNSIATSDSGSDTCQGMTNNGTTLLTGDITDKLFYFWTMNMTFLYTTPMNAGVNSPRGVCMNGSDIMQVTVTGDQVWMYEQLNGNDIRNWDTLQYGGGGIQSIACNESHIWLAHNDINGLVTQHLSDGTPTINFTLNASNDGPTGLDLELFVNSEFFWVSDNENQKAYKYGSGLFDPSLFAMTSTLNLPLNNTLTTNVSVVFNSTIEVTNANITNATFLMWHSNGSLFNSSTNFLTGNLSNTTSFNVTNFVADNFVWNVQACAINVTGTSCIVASSNFSFNWVAFTENSQTFNATAFETSQETFVLNISTGGTEIVTADLFYNGANEGAGTKTGTDAEAIFSKTLSVPKIITGVVNKSFNWIITIGSLGTSNSTKNNQTVFPINLSLCNAAISVPYINFTFKNETINQEDVNASFVSTWNYWLDVQSLNKSLSFSNSTTNPAYNFCFSPPSRAVNIVTDIAYNNPESQQRVFSLTSLLSNVTAFQTLYLLPTIKGLFAQFRAEDTVGNVLSLVKATITRTLGGSPITSVVDFTDSSGLVVMFLDPDILYTAVFSKSGFLDNTFTFVPITDQRVVIMGGTTITNVSGTEIPLNTTWQITPINGTLLNNSNVRFGFNVTSAQTISLISQNITNSSGAQLLFNSNAGQGFISGTINTGNLTRINGIFIIKTANETITISKTWFVGIEFLGDYSLKRQMGFYLDYGFSDFWRLLIVLAVIFGVVIFMTTGEITDTAESKIAAVTLLVWIFSFLGWLDNPVVVAQTGLAQFSQQFGIAILTTFGASYFVMRRLFIRRI